jgi:hypothetical protein
MWGAYGIGSILRKVEAVGLPVAGLGVIATLALDPGRPRALLGFLAGYALSMARLESLALASPAVVAPKGIERIGPPLAAYGLGWLVLAWCLVSVATSGPGMFLGFVSGLTVSTVSLMLYCALPSPFGGRE